jgi:hypothetical protein
MNWNTSNKRWGSVWTEVHQGEIERGQGNWYVIAALEGTLTGIHVADFWSESAARAFAEDFQQGKVFALKNGDQWVKMVDSAHAHRPLALHYPGNVVALLCSYGRTLGITTDGRQFGIKELRQLYESGGRI